MRKGINASCNNGNECIINTKCKSPNQSKKGFCQCREDRFWNGKECGNILLKKANLSNIFNLNFITCLAEQGSYNSSCSKDDQCKYIRDVKLVCTDSHCL